MNFVFSTNQFGVPEGASNTFGVKLSAEPFEIERAGQMQEAVTDLVGVQALRVHARVKTVLGITSHGERWK